MEIQFRILIEKNRLYAMLQSLDRTALKKPVSPPKALKNDYLR
ncbi:hypothetical protein [Cytobacillus sp. NCCP-133]|nr:hypothetical protein [Cytobacillus sp. NCCP-133]GLB59322.1 hypothetical protein NCCP133_14550 [Cytobacillus sp. NCCP-133]